MSSKSVRVQGLRGDIGIGSESPSFPLFNLTQRDRTQQTSQKKHFVLILKEQAFHTDRVHTNSDGRVNHHVRILTHYYITPTETKTSLPDFE